MLYCYSLEKNSSVILRVPTWTVLIMHVVYTLSGKGFEDNNPILLLVGFNNLMDYIKLGSIWYYCALVCISATL